MVQLISLWFERKFSRERTEVHYYGTPPEYCTSIIHVLKKDISRVQVGVEESISNEYFQFSQTRARFSIGIYQGVRGVRLSFFQVWHKICSFKGTIFSNQGVFGRLQWKLLLIVKGKKAAKGKCRFSGDLF